MPQSVFTNIDAKLNNNPRERQQAHQDICILQIKQWFRRQSSCDVLSFTLNRHHVIYLYNSILILQI